MDKKMTCPLTEAQCALIESLNSPQRAAALAYIADINKKTNIKVTVWALCYAHAILTHPSCRRSLDTSRRVYNTLTGTDLRDVESIVSFAATTA